MKDFRFFSIVAGVAMVASLVSCKKEPRNPETESVVKFQVIGNETKAKLNSTASINVEGKKFVIDLFDNTTKEVVRLGSVATCSLVEGKKEWPLDEITYWQGRTMDAWARYPEKLSGGSLGLIQSMSGDKVTGYTADTDGHIVKVDDDRTSESFNFLTYYDEGATPRMDASKQDDILFACTKGCKGSENNGRIKINFAHALSAIYFKIAADDENSELGEAVVLNSIAINNVKRAGSCVYDPSKDDAARFAWDTSDDKGLSRNKGSYVQTFDAALNGNEGKGGYVFGGSFEEAECFFLIPQTLEPDASLTINWSKNGVARDARTALISKDKNGNAITWKAGYKYLYSLRIKKHSAEIDVDVKVLPWDYNEINIDFDETVSGASPLVLSEGRTQEISATETRVIYDSRPIKGTFTLGKPAGSQWLVSLTDNEHFDLYLMDKDGNRNSEGNIVSGIVDDTPAVFYISPKHGLDPAQNYTTKLKVSILKPDGSTISADEQLGAAKYTILVPKKN